MPITHHARSRTSSTQPQCHTQPAQPMIYLSPPSAPQHVSTRSHTQPMHVHANAATPLSNADTNVFPFCVCVGIQWVVIPKGTSSDGNGVFASSQYWYDSYDKPCPNRSDHGMSCNSAGYMGSQVRFILQSANAVAKASGRDVPFGPVFGGFFLPLFGRSHGTSR